MRIRIRNQEGKGMRIHADPDPQPYVVHMVTRFSLLNINKVTEQPGSLSSGWVPCSRARTTPT